MIKVLIERHIATDLAELYEKAARSTLQVAMQAHGFISGESLKNSADPHHRIVIATFLSLEDWQRWYISSERKTIMAAIMPMLTTDEKITILEHEC
ncbi:antibiotic biosynthesis monooxygenase [Amphritea sp. 1_MG-2023]|uniref:antibiotic biosynthesis monooxygenase family protein n=1 Tax=Amphritea sp. 1_MG-2023 TaxID=3062670 RepID=UPI0026E1B5C4|nr:antibiotic biosynthesis monooxygenase [Amphritea sp. 1_MG-2023]MDO6563486.1 antibiotic biosynthesis monooxygenase [Amphritea sp. 1_MG-2023]